MCGRGEPEIVQRETPKGFLTVEGANATHPRLRFLGGQIGVLDHCTALSGRVHGDQPVGKFNMPSSNQQRLLFISSTVKVVSRRPGGNRTKERSDIMILLWMEGLEVRGRGLAF